MIRSASISGQKGFTLLEVMVALVIIGIAMVAMLGVTQRHIAANDRLQQMTRATFLAKQKMAEIEFNISGARDRYNGTFPPPDQNFSWEASIFSTPISGVDQIDLSVVWGDKKEQELVTLTSFLEAQGQ